MSGIGLIYALEFQKKINIIFLQFSKNLIKQSHLFLAYEFEYLSNKPFL